MTGTVNYGPFLDGARNNLEDPRAQGWLSGHNMDLKRAKDMGIGFYDPREHQDLSTILGEIYRAQGIEDAFRWDGPAMIVPWEDRGYFVGILIGIEGLSKYIYPRAGTPEIWGESSLWTSEGEPVVIAPGIEDALALRILGYEAIYLKSNQAGLLADSVKAKAPNGPIVIIPENMEKKDPQGVSYLFETLNNQGVPTLCYDFSNFQGQYSGAMETLKTEGADSLRAVMNSLREWTATERRNDKALYLQGTTGAYLETFKKAIGNRMGEESTPTGFRSLDAILDGGLYPGLYIMGAVSSLGKTTFMLQIADYIAEHGRDVLFFSAEQSKDELIAKSLARLTASIEWVNDFPLTSRQILYKMKDWIGKKQEGALESAFKTYGDKIGPRMFIIENDVRPMVRENKEGDLETVKDSQGNDLMEIDRIGLDTIRDRVKEHIKIMGRAPVLFIDYLQILRPDDPTGRLSDKQNMDQTVSELRRISKEYGVPIVAISSLNRSAYGQPITMESFKESGAIEYSSDVLIGLNPRGLKAGDKGKDNNRGVFDKLRAETEREMEAVILKNRIGTLGDVPLLFNAPYGLYYEDGTPSIENVPYDRDKGANEDYAQICQYDISDEN